MGSLIGQKDWSPSRLQKILELAYSKAAGANPQNGYENRL